jgi:hypothetical protein
MLGSYRDQKMPQEAALRRTLVELFEISVPFEPRESLKRKRPRMAEGWHVGIWLSPSDAIRIYAA